MNEKMWKNKNDIITIKGEWTIKGKSLKSPSITN